jgi:hypothetical protein
MMKGAGSHPIDESLMRQWKRDNALMFIDDGGLKMAIDEFGDTCNSRRKKGW